KYVLASRETATDRDFQGIESVIAHEYFHNWTGNRITCRDWFQLSLKEGLTVFRDQEFSADMGSRGVKRIEDVRLLRAHQFAEDASPMAHPVRPDSYMEINNFYTVTVYEKGAEVVRMQANLLGPECYRQATDLYFERFDGQAVTTDDFVQCMADASGRDLSQFKRWYSQAGTPELMIGSDYDADQQRYTLTVEQHCPATPGQSDKGPFLIPLAMGLLGQKGEALPLQLEGATQAPSDTLMLEVSERRQSFVFTGIKEQPIPALLRGFSAPVKVHYDYRDEELMFLMANETDGFCRWDAAQSLAQRILLARVASPEAEIPLGFIEAFKNALTDKVSDKALLSEVLTLPSESYLGDQMDEVDVEGIHRSRESLKKALALALKEDFLAVYQENNVGGSYVPDAASISRRSLKNLALSYLMQTDDSEAQSLCINQFSAGHNMTDVLSALSLMADRVGPEGEALLEQFYQQWKDDPLVMDKWFTLQAISKRPDTLDRVKALMGHPAFSIANPNKVRSLIGAFCAGNAVCFHAADGSGYQFLGDRVLELDSLNPQVASRMVRIMARWQRYDPQRQQLMKAQLERILKTEGVSRDVFEIASKSLEQ
ncbi:MAG: aminopeptidase N, partial [Sedimenticola sp.]|nr:aminopeptidase N [Sedimenticola sp.]